MPVLTHTQIFICIILFALSILTGYYGLELIV